MQQHLKIDKPLVQLVAISKPVGDGTTEDFVAYVARVSNPANQNNQATAPKLIRYLVDNQHWSPFEMVSITIEINTSRDIGRQILRHRSFSFQEFSQRYAEAPGFVTPREARLQDRKNRQNSITTKDDKLTQLWNESQQSIVGLADETYKAALSAGIAKEQARVVLPEGLTETRMYMAGTLRSWIHYCLLRMGHGTQKEHMEVAAACWDIICKEFPSISGLFNPLDSYIDEFVLKLKKKLRKKAEEGKSGWDDMNWSAVDRHKALSKELREEGDPIDLAAYSIFLEWYYENNR
jgi:thymidylate synthase (FAD)